MGIVRAERSNDVSIAKAGTHTLFVFTHVPLPVSSLGEDGCYWHRSKSFDPLLGARVEISF